MVRMAVTTQSAFERTWALHQEQVRRLLVSMSRDLNLTDDLLQETYLLAHRGWEGYHGGDARAWLTAIARNAFHMHHRRRYLRAEVPLPDNAGTDSGFSDDMLDIRQVLSALPDAMRAALLLRFYGELSYQEIAARQHSPVGTAKWRVSAAIGRLKVALGITEEHNDGLHTYTNPVI